MSFTTTTSIKVDSTASANNAVNTFTYNGVRTSPSVVSTSVQINSGETLDLSSLIAENTASGATPKPRVLTMIACQCLAGKFDVSIKGNGSGGDLFTGVDSSTYVRHFDVEGEDIPHLKIKAGTEDPVITVNVFACHGRNPVS